MENEDKKSVEKIEEKFIPLETKSIDSKHRITLGKKLINQIYSKLDANSFKVFIGEEGDILLRPVTSIPAKEAWIYEKPEIIESIRKGLEEAKEGKVKEVEDLDKFIKEL